mgnify:CR=1 FL=1
MITEHGGVSRTQTPKEMGDLWVPDPPGLGGTVPSGRTPMAVPGPSPFLTIDADLCHL